LVSGSDLDGRDDVQPGGKRPDENAVKEEVGSVDAWVFTGDGSVNERRQWVIKERPVTLYLNGEEIVTLLCAGHHLDELAAGFFYAEGFVGAREDILRFQIDESAGKVDVITREVSSLANRMWMKRTITSGCGKGSLFYFALDALLSKPVESDLQVSPRQVQARVEDLNHLSDTYRRTHGVHNTILATPDEVVLFRDDIGRHNAVDMITGHAFLHDVALNDKILVTTGRLTSEILIKVAKVGIPILVSRNTATTLAVELARSLNITLIGYARAGRFALYSGRHRIRE
jgi:FdhD protein